MRCITSSRRFRAAARLPVLVVASVLSLVQVGDAAPVTVRFAEGNLRGLLVIRSAAGETIGHGELTQVLRGDLVEGRTVLTLRDGSLHDETVVVSQRGVFAVESYRLVQQGPAFASAQEVSVDRKTGSYQARLRGRGESEDQAASGRLDVPADLVNGMHSVLVKNLPRGATASGHMLAFTPRPRLLRAVLAPEAEDTVLLGDAPRKAARYLVSLEIGGVVGTLASLVGKSPPDLRYWILGGEMPVFVRFEGALSLNGPVWRIEQTTVRWP